MCFGAVPWHDCLPAADLLAEVVLASAGIISVNSRRFPDSESSAHFWANLRDGRDMVTLDGRRWPAGLHNTPPRFGKLIEFDRFDASFFSVHGKQAQVRSDC